MQHRRQVVPFGGSGGRGRRPQVPGLCAPADRAFLERAVFPAFRAGDDARAAAALGGRAFTRCGLTRRAVRLD